MKAVVLAGGFGTRLRARAPDLPKPMVPVAGRPFLEYVLDGLCAGGIERAVLSVGYRAEAIQRHFGHRYRGIELGYSVESEPLGTGGALVLALRGDRDEAVLVLNGDTYLQLDYRRLVDWYQDDPVPAAIVLRSVPDVARYGSVQVADGRVTGFSEKCGSGPGLVNAGVYVLRPDVLVRAAPGERFSLEQDYLQPRCSQLRPRAFVADGYFIDIGTPEDLDRARRELPAAASRPGA